ncbi:transcriptional regulator, MarR family [Alicyclobacillus hesperidum URH17-3-68]|uniref:hypothetical protein n=1 Tax=Alicyclobacillus hesperidum TaxID=89784 RepID=UPI000281B86F|nr:hypothetical protein [Alicyclobacillus hesperidum]EJY56442.1 transcriptional regulator, MarR family [Alicyclobacillus hesperidum URH17-3-68]
MPNIDLEEKVRRVRKEGSLKVQSKAEALDIIDYAHATYGYRFRLSGTRFCYLVVDEEG